MVGTVFSSPVVERHRFLQLDTKRLVQLVRCFYSHVSEELEESDVQLSAVEVELRELEGKKWGAARLEV